MMRGRMKEETNIDLETVDTGGLGGARIIIKNQQRRLGLQGPLSEAGTPPAHNSDTLNGPGAGNSHTHKHTHTRTHTHTHTHTHKHIIIKIG